MYKMLVLDIDGTLYNNRHELTPRTREAVRLAREKGVRIAIATSRAFGGAARAIKDLGIDDLLVIAGAGTSVWDCATNEELCHLEFAPELARQAIDFFRGHGYDFWVVKHDGSYYYERKTPNNRAYMRTFGYEGTQVDFDGWDCTDVCKLVVITSYEDEDCKKTERMLDDAYPGKFFAMKVWLCMLDVYAAGAGKELGMRQIAGRLGIPMEEVIAVGDDVIDQGIVEEAGLGVAMGNADARLKAAADYVAPTNDEDGVADVVERFILQTQK